MSRAVYLTRVTLRIPSIDSWDTLRAATARGESRPTFESSVHSGGETLEFAHAELSASSPYYPSPRDLKVLRSDVIALTMCAQELVREEGFKPEQLEDSALFVAAGICLNDLSDEIARITQAFLPAHPGEAVAKRNERVTNAAHPLFALKALTNAGETYVAQYARILGNNTTFGNSSHSAFDALRAGFDNVASGRSEKAFVAASNGSGAFTFLTYRNFAADSSLWREGNGAVFLLLESEESLQARGRKPLGKIEMLREKPVAPDLFGGTETVTPGRPGQKDASDGFTWVEAPAAGSVCLFSGNLSGKDHLLAEARVAAHWKKSFSWYPSLGCLGVADFLVHIGSALALLNDQTGIPHVDCVNRDPYGKEAFVRIGRAT